MTNAKTNHMENKKSKHTNLTLREWWDHVGTENIERVVEDLGTSMNYMRRLRYSQNMRPSGRLALRIIDAARRITPGFEPSLLLMLEPPVRPEPANRPKGKKIPPSGRFLRDQQRVQQQVATQ